MDNKNNTQDKTKNIVIIILAVFLFISVIINIVGFSKDMHDKRFNDGMMRNNMNDRMRNMPRSKGNMPFDENQDTQKNETTNESQENME